MGEMLKRRAGRKQMTEMRHKLKQYEELEQQGFLLKLQFRLGDTAYAILSTNGQMIVARCEVFAIESIRRKMWFGDVAYLLEGVARRGTVYRFYDSDIGKVLFHTADEAERALAKME